MHRMINPVVSGAMRGHKTEKYKYFIGSHKKPLVNHIRKMFGYHKDRPIEISKTTVSGQVKRRQQIQTDQFSSHFHSSLTERLLSWYSGHSVFKTALFENIRINTK